LAMDSAPPGSLYNVSAGTPRPNLKIVRAILQALDKPESLIQYVQDRPGHDRRYALDSSKIQRELGWAPAVSFEDGIRKTINWYRTNRQWLDHARSGEYRGYYERHYDRRSQTFGN
jgi:dTDP-glucose 4,6-dehydratase